MRCLDRNKRKIIYALFDSMTEDTETVNNVTYKTGRRTEIYKDAVITGGNIDESGRANYDPQGVFPDHIMNIIMDADCPFDETTILWVNYDAEYYDTDTEYKTGDYCVNGTVYRCIADTDGEFDATKWTSVPHNYHVTSVHHSINNVRVYARESQD